MVGMSLGGGMAVLETGCGHSGAGLAGAASAEDAKGAEPPTPRYISLSPELAAARAYALYPEGSCMYATVKSIVTLVAEKDPRAAPPMVFEMFKYGRGGVGDWGTLCGACNGAAAVFGLFHQDAATRERLIDQLFRWYETTALPQFEPPDAADSEILASKPESVLCHVSVSRWCVEADVGPQSPERKERCRRLTADVVAQSVRILNAQAEAEANAIRKRTDAAVASRQEAAASGPTTSCIDCHSAPGDYKGLAADVIPKSSVRMDCLPCHTMTNHYEDY